MQYEYITKLYIMIWRDFIYYTINYFNYINLMQVVILDGNFLRLNLKSPLSPNRFFLVIPT